MSATVLNISDLSNGAKKYDPLLKTLPFEVLRPVLADLGIRLLEVGDGENIEATFERKGGLLGPYSKTTSDQDASEKEIGKFVEMPLVTKAAAAKIKDHIQNYTSDATILTGPDAVDDKTKRHPLEQLILETKVRTVGEDQIDAMFHSARNTADASPMGICDGFFTLQDAFVVSGDIATGKGNLLACGDLDAPESESDFTAFTSLKEWLRGANPSLRKSAPYLYIPSNILMNVKDAALCKFRNFQGNITTDQLAALLADQADIPNLMIKSHTCLGTGTRLTLSVPFNLDYGMNMESNAQFVQIRNPYPDPNWIQFWLQFKVGQRIRSLNKKMFMISDGTTVSQSLAGDYS